jgi:probable HAF family extracellular repeat protein
MMKHLARTFMSIVTVVLGLATGFWATAEVPARHDRPIGQPSTRRKAVWRTALLRAFTAVVAVAATGIVAGVVAGPAAGNPAHPRVTLVELGNLGRPWTMAEAMNERGDVVGIGNSGDDLVHMFRWRDGAMVDLGLRGTFDFTRATGIDESGRVIGTVGAPTGNIGFLWDEGTVTNLSFAPRAINDRGQIVGTLSLSVLIWDNGITTDITPVGLSSAGQRLINDRGQVAIDGAFWASGPTGPEAISHGMLWQDGHWTDLGNLGGQNTTVSGINEQGWVTGTSQTADGVNHPYLWRDGVMHPLGRLDAPAGEGFALNRQGDVVGRYTAPGDLMRPAVWRGGAMIDLGVPGLYGQANLVDDRGGVVGVNSDFSSPRDDQAFLWRHGSSTPLPRPTNTSNCQPVATNRAGTRIAGSVFADDQWRAVLWIIN